MLNQILVVEPDPSVRDLLSEMVTEVGYAPVLCSRATEAHNLLHRMRVAGLIVNVWLNGDHEDGVARTRLLSTAADQRLPLIAISTEDKPIHVTLNDGDAFVYYPFVMPFDLGDFLEAISQTMDGAPAPNRLIPEPGSLDCSDDVAIANQC